MGDMSKLEEIARLTARVTELEQEATELEGMLHNKALDSARIASELTDQLEAAEKRVAELKAALTAEQQRRQEVERERDALHDALDLLADREDKAKTALAAERDEARAELAATKELREGDLTALSRSCNELSAALADRSELVEKIRKARRQRNEAVADAAVLRHKLAEVERERGGLSESCATYESTIRRRNEDLEAFAAENSRLRAELASCRKVVEAVAEWAHWFELRWCSLTQEDGSRQELLRSSRALLAAYEALASTGKDSGEGKTIGKDGSAQPVAPGEAPSVEPSTSAIAGESCRHYFVHEGDKCFCAKCDEPWGGEESAQTEAASVEPSKLAKCFNCGNPATCYGSYEGAPPAYACDACCGHGCEDGKCERFAPPNPRAAELRMARVRADVDRLMRQQEESKPPNPPGIPESSGKAMPSDASPLPWSVSEGRFIVDADEMYVAQAEIDKDAAFIVERCNAPEPSATINARPVVRWFAEQMELKLRKNDHKGGWHACEEKWLLMRAGQELDELRDCISHLGPPNDVVGEAADVANMVMMAADHYREGGPSKDSGHDVATHRAEPAATVPAVDEMRQLRDRLRDVTNELDRIAGKEPAAPSTPDECAHYQHKWLYRRDLNRSKCTGCRELMPIGLDDANLIVERCNAPEPSATVPRGEVLRLVETARLQMSAAEACLADAVELLAKAEGGGK